MPKLTATFEVRLETPLLVRHSDYDEVNGTLNSDSVPPDRRLGYELASRSACASPWVNQEFGATIASAQKTLIPVVWDLRPSGLPGWMAQLRAIDLSHATATEVWARFSAIAEKIHRPKATGALIAAGLLAAFRWALSGDDDGGEEKD
jgi:hypothetical protein